MFNFMAILYVSIFPIMFSFSHAAKIVSEYDQEIPQSQIADNPVAPRGRAAQPSRDTKRLKQSNQ